MMRPIRLHLDRSDYAIMYRAAPGTPEAHVRDELTGMKESGRIEIGMSYHVVFELLQKAEPKFRDDRLARGRLLTQLCGRNAFPYPSDLGCRFSTEGLWVPRIDLDDIEIERLVRNAMETIAHRPELSRRERRAFSKRSYFVEWSRNNSSEFRRLTGEQWPLLFGREFQESGDFRRYILGQITRSEANKKLRFYITDPVAVYETWFENYGRDNPVPERGDKIASKFLVMLNERHPSGPIVATAFRVASPPPCSLPGSFASRWTQLLWVARSSEGGGLYPGEIWIPKAGVGTTSMMDERAMSPRSGSCARARRGISKTLNGGGWCMVLCAAKSRCGLRKRGQALTQQIRT
jgi:hypothetical protein